MYPAQPDSPDFELAADISDSATSITFIDLTGLLAAPNTLTLRQGDSDTTPETFYYATYVSGNTLTVTRGYGGTVAKAFTAGAMACRAHTALDHNTLRANILDIVSSLSGYAVDTAVFHKATAGEINALTLKATPAAADVLMIEDSAGGTFDKKKIAISTLPFQSVLTNPVTGSAASFTAGRVITATGSGVQVQDSGTLLTSLALNPAVLGSPTLTTLQDFLNGTGSGGRIYGGVITSAGSGLVNISALKGFIVIADYSLGVDAPAAIKFFDLAAQTNWGGSGTGTTLSTDNINYIYVDYNAGTPVVKCTTDRSTIRETDQFTLGRVFKIDASTVEVLVSGVNLYDRVRLTHEKWIDTFGGLSYANGMDVSTTAGSGGTTPNLGPRPAFTAGTFYAGSNKIPISAVDCNAGGTFTKFYYNPTTAAWVKTAGLTQLDNVNYNNTSTGTGLTALTTNRYGVHWLYICPENEMCLLLGQGDYTLAQAQAATVPSLLPNYLSQWCKLAAKIIVQKSSTSAYQIVSAWTTSFPVTQPTDHNSLTGLQGGTTGEYYHLKAAQVGSWAAFSPSPAWGTADPTITTTVARYCRTGNTVTFNVSFVISNGNAASSLTMALPVAAPQTANYQLPLVAFKKITTGGNSIMSDPFAYIDYTLATPVIKFNQFGTLPAGYTAVLNISGSYEVAA
jgi:hypothetical protein